MKRWILEIAYEETYKLPINITRCSNNYGPYHFPEKLIPLMIKNILEGKKLPVYGKGDNVRDWLYVEDHCKGIDLAFSFSSVISSSMMRWRIFCWLFYFMLAIYFGLLCSFLTPHSSLNSTVS